MSIWNKVLLGLILVASLAFWFLTMRVVKTHHTWRTVANKLEAQKIKLQAEQEDLLGTSDKAAGIRQATLQLHQMLMDRGRVWYNCTPRQVDVAGGTVKVRLAVDTLDAVPDAGEVQQLPVQSVVFLFESKDLKDGGRYLGEFAVTAVAEKQGDNPKELELQPTMKLADAQIQRLQASQQAQTPWIMYDIMPADEHEVFAELSEEELKELLPASSVEAYVKHGKPSDPNDPKSVFQRKLWDYEVLFRMCHLRQAILTDAIAAATRDVASLKAALDDAETKQKPFCQEEIDRLKAELAKVTRERDAVIAHRQAVEATLAQVTLARDQLLAANRASAAELAAVQERARQIIDRRTRSMAQRSSEP